jgi:hypothetical protein
LLALHVLTSWFRPCLQPCSKGPVWLYTSDTCIYIYRDLIVTQHHHNNCTTPSHMGVDPTHWVPLPCEGVLYSCCSGVVNLSFSIYIYTRNNPYTYFSQQPHNKLTWLVIFYYFFVLFCFVFLIKYYQSRQLVVKNECRDHFSIYIE